MTFVNTGIVVTCVKSFPRGRGLVIGLLNGFVSLSGAIITRGDGLACDFYFVGKLAGSSRDSSFLPLLTVIC